MVTSKNMVEEAPFSIFGCAKEHHFIVIIAVTTLPWCCLLLTLFPSVLVPKWCLLSSMGILQSLHWSQVGEDSSACCTSTFHGPPDACLLEGCPIWEWPRSSRSSSPIVVATVDKQVPPRGWTKAPSVDTSFAHQLFDFWMRSCTQVMCWQRSWQKLKG